MDEYTVEHGDTVQRVAIKFNCNPSDISKENKLSPFQAVLFVGQKLKIPKPREISRKCVESSSKVNLRAPLRSHPGTATRISAPLPSTKSLNFESDIFDISERQFVKLKASRVVDYSLVPCSGTLLITPKFLVFDPERVVTDEDPNDAISLAEPMSNVAVSISLESVFSLNTYSKLSEVINEKQIIFEGSTDSSDVDSFEFIDEEDNSYLVIKAVPMLDSHTGQSFTSASINTLHADCKLFSFGIPKDRTEEVYIFLISCIGAAYNNVRPIAKDPDWITKRDDEESMADNNNQSSVVADALKEFEQIKFRPQCKHGKSDILTDSMLEDLASGLPLNLNGCNLTLVYKTGTHGYSLGTIYRKMKTFNSSTLLVIRDSSNTVFGAFMSDPCHISTHYYGTGETFVFHWKPDFKKYEWTRDNSFFMKGDTNCFAIGAKSGHNAIWFEDTLKFGRSEPTDTFDNPTLCGDCKDQNGTNTAAVIASLSVDKSILTNEDNVDCQGYFFVIDCLEVWRFCA